jgi:hypothetical protein
MHWLFAAKDTISNTVNNSSMADVQRRHGQIKKPLCISEYNMFMKGVDKAEIPFRFSKS